MSLLLALAFALPAALLPQDLDEARQALQSPGEVFPLFQKLVLAGRYGDAHNWTLSPQTRASLPYDPFYLALTGPEMSLGVSRRLLGSLEVARVDEAARTVCVVSPEFGFRWELRLAKFRNFWALDFTRDELRSFTNYFAGRAMAWYRLQVKRADGWHYAYPPDWTYAPLARSVECQR